MRIPNPLLSIFTVSFFGHRQIGGMRTIEDRLEEWITAWLRAHEQVDFLVGRNGDFDQVVSSTIQRVKNTGGYDNGTHILVLPYPSAAVRRDEEGFAAYYDEIEVCPASHGAHFKAAIALRNRNMIDRSDLCVFYVDHPFGGAYQSLRYAVRQNKPYINMARDPDGY